MNGFVVVMAETIAERGMLSTAVDRRCLACFEPSSLVNGPSRPIGVVLRDKARVGSIESSHIKLSGAAC
jgi:hypothetical protein